MGEIAKPFPFDRFLSFLGSETGFWDGRITLVALGSVTTFRSVACFRMRMGVFSDRGSTTGRRLPTDFRFGFCLLWSPGKLECLSLAGFCGFAEFPKLVVELGRLSLAELELVLATWEGEFELELRLPLEL